MVEGDFAKRNQDSFSVSRGLPKNGKWRTKVLSGGLPKNGKRRTKVSSDGLLKNGKWRTKVLGFSGVFQKMEKTKIHKFRVGFRRTENPKIHLGWVSEEWKKKTNLNGLVQEVTGSYFEGLFWKSIFI
ncbi:unnamed protein product [Rhizophagus irregularis]|nr:unnamed protein product [Rhizophagus irregularis]